MFPKQVPDSSLQRKGHAAHQISSRSGDALLQIMPAEERAVQPVPINRNDGSTPFSQEWMCTTERVSFESMLTRPLDGSPKQKVVGQQFHEFIQRTVVRILDHTAGTEANARGGN